jgi:hypothetical protein
MVTCSLRYEIDSNQIEAFEKFARTWIDLVNRMGGTHHGYFMPSEGAIRVRADAVPVTTCGQRFSGYGYLVRDLDCSGYPSYGVELDGGTLSLSGFTLTGGKYGVLCHRSCTVVNGTVEGAREDGIVAIKNAKVVNVTVRDNGFTGVKAGAAAMVERSVLTGNARCGVQGLRRVRLKNVVSRDNDCGANGSDSTVVIDSELVDNAHHGILSDRIVAKRSTIRDNHSGDRCGVTLLEQVPKGGRRSSGNRRARRATAAAPSSPERRGGVFPGRTGVPGG